MDNVRTLAISKADPKGISAVHNDPPRMSKSNTSILASLKRIGSILRRSGILYRMFSWRKASIGLPLSDNSQGHHYRALPLNFK
jgi:hypothetical protein